MEILTADGYLITYVSYLQQHIQMVSEYICALTNVSGSRYLSTGNYYWILITVGPEIALLRWTN
jgi:hypothetical protein